MKKQITKVSQVSRNKDTGEISFIVGAVYAGKPYYFYYRTWSMGFGLQVYVESIRDYATVWSSNQFRIPGKEISAIKKWIYDHYQEFSYSYPMKVEAI